MNLAQPAAAADYDRVVDASEMHPAFAFVKDAISDTAVDAARAWFDIDEHEPPSTSRRRAAGELDLARFKAWRPDVVALEPVSPTSARVRLADGRVLRQVFCNPVRSYVAGYTVSRFGNRAGAAKLTRRYIDRWNASRPFFEAVDRALLRILPRAHERMTARAATHPAWRITDALSTVAINVNYASHYHRDTGDFKDGVSTLSVVGDFDGGLLVFPGHRVAVDIRPGDVLFMRAHVDVHGNTPVTRGRRVSFVTYLKHGLADTVNAMEAA